MKLFTGLDQIVKYDEPLAKHCWMGLGGPAKYFITPGNREELAEVVKRCRKNNLAMQVLGQGANLLVLSKRVDAAVIRLSPESFTQIEIEGTKVHAAAGADLPRLVRQCIRAGLSGLEPLVGIPGTVGGGVRMNAGGRFGDIGAAISSVDVMDSAGRIHSREKESLVFGYRRTNIAAKFILGACFDLEPDDPQRVLRQAKQMWIFKKNSQPLANKSAGCVFRNPRALSAGALIDQAGLKGERIGGAMISPIHANFIVVDKSAKPKDVQELISLMRQKVQEKFEVQLELELEIW